MGLVWVIVGFIVVVGMVVLTQIVGRKRRASPSIMSFEKKNEEDKRRDHH